LLDQMVVSVIAIERSAEKPLEFVDGERSHARQKDYHGRERKHWWARRWNDAGNEAAGRIHYVDQRGAAGLLRSETRMRRAKSDAEENESNHKLSVKLGNKSVSWNGLSHDCLSRRMKLLNCFCGFTVVLGMTECMRITASGDGRQTRRRYGGYDRECVRGLRTCGLRARKRRAGFRHSAF
jgi:hypothetical protein